MNANQMIEQGKQLAETLQLAAAEQKFAAALHLEPQSVIAMTWLGRLALMRNEQETANRYLRLAISIDPKQAEAIGLQGLGELQNGNLEAAFDLMHAALALDPDLEWVHGNLASCCRLLGKTDAAEAAARKGIQLNPRNAVAHYELACLLGDQNKGEEALAHCVEAINSNPFFQKAYVALGTLFTVAGKVEQAKELYRKGLTLMPDAHMLRDQLCALLFSRGELQAAIAETIESIERRNDVADHLRLGIYKLVAAEYEKTIVSPPLQR